MPEYTFSALKVALKLNENVKTRKIANILETAAKSSKFQPLALCLGFLGMIVGLKIIF